ncbi:MAG: HipA domain-containing protein [Quadrisphaera sp.]
MKLSLVAAGDRLVLPLGGVRGDWIVKFPDAALPHLPVVEHLTMQVARRVGIEVPSIKLLHRDEVPETPSTLWAAGEELAFGIERFDRAPDRTSIHIEDFAQVRGVWPSQKYDGRYEVLAALTHRGHDWDSLRELVRRLIFNVLVDNSDAHLKNFSLIYRDPRRPVLAPAYDIVSVAPYDGYGGEMALSLGGNRRPARMRVADFGRLARGTDVSAEELVDVAALVVRSVEEAWEAALDEHPVELPASVSAMGEVIAERVRSLVG